MLTAVTGCEIAKVFEDNRNIVIRHVVLGILESGEVLLKTIYIMLGGNFCEMIF